MLRLYGRAGRSTAENGGSRPGQSGLATAKNLFGLPTFLTKRDAWSVAAQPRRYRIPSTISSIANLPHFCSLLFLSNLFAIADLLRRLPPPGRSGSLTELLTLEAPRTDCPMHFPESPPVAIAAGHRAIQLLLRARLSHPWFSAQKYTKRRLDGSMARGQVAGPWTAPGTHNEASELRRLAEAAGPEAQHCGAQTPGVCEGTAAVSPRGSASPPLCATAHRTCTRLDDIFGASIGFLERPCNRISRSPRGKSGRSTRSRSTSPRTPRQV
jgi:hypothetical protein